MRPTVMEVNLSNFKHNVESIKAKLSSGTKIMPIIKANAYGTYINTKLDILNEFDIVAVAITDEGEQLRKIGYEKEIFVLNQPDIDEIDKIIANNLTVGISGKNFVEALGRRKENVKVHIEIGTGMGRTGIHPDRTSEYIDFVQSFENIKIEGIYTHMSSADTDDEYTKKQINSFEKAIAVANAKVENLKYVHSSASNGIINFPQAHYNLVRPGIILYGYESGDGILDKIDLKPVCKLKSKIVLLKDVKAGTSIGYARSFITEKETKVATIPIGYADGMRRALSNIGEVVINGQKAPIIGKICMDGFMADVSNIENVKVGDDVWIWDNENITLEEIAKNCDTINYDIMCTISNRVPRIFTEK